MELIIVSPLLVLLSATILCVLFFNNPSAQKVIALMGNFLYLCATLILFLEVQSHGILSMQVGDWPAPFGITLVVDTFSACMLMITSIVSICTFLFALEDVSSEQKAVGFYPVFLFLIFGVSGSFLTGDIFNLYVWYEIMLLASFVLISLGNTKEQLEGAVKYVILSFLASGFFLVGIGLLYKGVGSLNLADIATIMQGEYNQTLVGLSSVFFITGFGVKSGIFPFFFWLPSSYHTPPASISSLMAGLLTKVGVYTFIRMYTLIFDLDPFTYKVLWWVAALTMITGVLGAMAQKDFRKILSFHIISQIGYMIMGLVIYTPLAIAGAVFYIIHHIIVKSNLFLISGIVNSLRGSYKLGLIGGVYKYYPFITGIFVISAFSLAGIPPLSGFWSKFILVKAGMANNEYLLVAISLVVGLLTLFSMVKIWNQVFWEKTIVESGEENVLTWSSWWKRKYLMIIPVVVFALLTLGIGLYPAYLIDLAMQAADELSNPQLYIESVLNKSESQ